MASSYQYEINIHYSPRNHWDNSAIERVENQIIEYMRPVESESSQPKAKIIGTGQGLGDLTIEIYTRDLEITEIIRKDLENLIKGINIQILNLLE